METSSFAALLSRERRDSDDFDSCVEPLGYRDRSFKRARTFSDGGHFDDVASHDGDNSIVFEQ